MKVEYLITYKSGAKASGVIDWENTNEKRGFAQMVHTALVQGAVVTTQIVDMSRHVSLREAVHNRLAHIFGWATT